MDFDYRLLAVFVGILYGALDYQCLNALRPSPSDVPFQSFEEDTPPVPAMASSIFFTQHDAAARPLGAYRIFLDMLE